MAAGLTSDLRVLSLGNATGFESLKSLGMINSAWDSFGGPTIAQSLANTSSAQGLAQVQVDAHADARGAQADRTGLASRPQARPQSGTRRRTTQAQTARKKGAQRGGAQREGVSFT